MKRPIFWFAPTEKENRLEMMTLAELAVGKRARVKEIAGADHLASRLMEMGLIPGTDLTMMGTAPWGDPIEIEVRGYRLSLRKKEAERVTIIMTPVL